MNNFIVALVIIALITAFVFINGYIITSNCEDMISLIEEGQVESAFEIWEEKKEYFSLFIKDSEIDTVAREFYKIKGDTSLATEALVSAIEELKCGERAEIVNIL